MSAEPITYERAVERLEEIIRRLDSNQAGLRETLDLCKEGKGLIALHCASAMFTEAPRYIPLVGGELTTIVPTEADRPVFRAMLSAAASTPTFGSPARLRTPPA